MFEKRTWMFGFIAVPAVVETRKKAYVFSMPGSVLGKMTKIPPKVLELWWKCFSSERNLNAEVTCHVCDFFQAKRGIDGNAFRHGEGESLDHRGSDGVRWLDTLPARRPERGKYIDPDDEDLTALALSTFTRTPRHDICLCCMWNAHMDGIDRIPLLADSCRGVLLCLSKSIYNDKILVR